MALKLNVSLPNGLGVEGAYHRVSSISGSKTKIDFTLTIYKSQEDYDNGLSCVGKLKFDFIPSVEIGSDNFIQQAYNHLKSLMEYQEAQDC